ncbi:unnamed protein product [Pedinophyceae sp. YPF-701]|nr:unnamed protein product [Pedinophyceae sp. YPF-701]
MPAASLRPPSALVAAQRPRPAQRRAARPAVVAVRAHGQAAGHGGGHGGATAAPPTGFIAEMRTAAMKLHTREQAPKEGQKVAEKPAEQPVKKWTPTREGYLRFLVESKIVYDAIEDIIANSDHPDLQRFQNSGLERGAALEKDIAWMKEKYGAEVGCSPEGCAACNGSSPGHTYASSLRKMAAESPTAFVCHYYNTYFAHTAGGLMIGKKMSDELLEGATLEFYKWDGDVKEYLAAVRDQINAAAEGWSQEEKQACLDQTADSFKAGGALLGLVAS